VGAECRQRITDVNPEIKLWDASNLAAAEERGDSASREQYDSILVQAEVVCGFIPPKNVIARAPELKWLHSMLAGVDRFLDVSIAQSQVILSNTRGIHGTQVSELVFEMMLMFAKEALLCFQLKQERKWKSFIPARLRSKTIGILGLGNIGLEIARLAKAFGMNVLAVDETRGLMRSKYVDTMVSTDKLQQLLSESDFVVIALPLTPKTNKLISERELRAMKSTAYLINCARGSIVDEEALIRALDERWIAGAGLDTFDTEPLPTESRLWELPNVIFSPHVAGIREDYNILATDMFCENLRRYLSNERLLNIVDKKKGY
jgi:D-2-hydroxyacid dehydrogenase (NADP+)